MLTAILKMIVGAMTLYKIVQIINVENPEFDHTSDGFQLNFIENAIQKGVIKYDIR